MQAPGTIWTEQQIVYIVEVFRYRMLSCSNLLYAKGVQDIEVKRLDPNVFGRRDLATEESIHIPETRFVLSNILTVGLPIGSRFRLLSQSDLGEAWGSSREKPQNI